MARTAMVLPVALAGAAYALLVRGQLTLDLRIGRRARPLGPITRAMAAPSEVVFDVIAAPFRLLRDPVPHVVESYELRDTPAGCEFVHTGELGADPWALGRWWADRVARPWERAVATSLDQVQAEAERRASRQAPRTSGGPGSTSQR